MKSENVYYVCGFYEENIDEVYYLADKDTSAFVYNAVSKASSALRFTSETSCKVFIDCLLFSNMIKYLATRDNPQDFYVLLDKKTKIKLFNSSYDYTSNIKCIKVTETLEEEFV